MTADYPGCNLAVDLAGRQTWDGPTSTNSERVRDTAKAIVKQCVEEKGEGGFGTIHLTDTVDQLTKGYGSPWGYGEYITRALAGLYTHLDHS